MFEKQSIAKVLAGSISPDGTYYDMEVAKLALDGSLEWGWTLDHAQAEFAHGVVRTTDGGFVIVGSGEAVGSLSCVLVVKFNALGDLLWSRAVSEQASNHAFALAVAATDDGGIVVSGVYVDAGRDLPFVLRFDQQGTLQWKYIYQFAGTDMGKATCITTVADGGYLVGGYQNGNGGVAARGWIMRLDAVGQSLWSKRLGQNSTIGGVASNGSAEYVFGGSVDGTLGSGGYSDLLMFKIDVNGQLVWDALVGTGGDESGNGITRTADDGYVAGGSITAGAGQQTYLAKVNDTGQLLWTRKIGGFFSTYECDAIGSKPSGGLALGVRSSDGTQLDMGLVLTNNLGMPCPLCVVDSGGSIAHGITMDDFPVTRIIVADTLPYPLTMTATGTSAVVCDGVGIAQISDGAERLIIAPQPMSGSATVTVPGSWLRAGDIELTLFDELGKEVAHFAIRHSTSTIARGPLSAGVYHYRISRGASIFATGNMMME